MENGNVIDLTQEAPWECLSCGKRLTGKTIKIHDGGLTHWYVCGVCGGEVKVVA